MKTSGQMHHLWRAVDHEGEALKAYASTARDNAAALKFIKKAVRRHGRPKAVVTHGLRACAAALKDLGGPDRRASHGLEDATALP